jgi:hypothetical protein
MTIHSGDDFARQGPKDLGLDLGPHGEWPRPQTLPRPIKSPLSKHETHTPRLQRSVTPDWNQASTDSTNMSMLEQGLIHPEDL